MRNRHITAIVSIALAVAFTVYIALDTFVIARSYEVVEAAGSGAEATETTVDDVAQEGSTAATSSVDGEDQEGSTAAMSSADSEDQEGSTAATDETVTVTDTSYEDSNISINISTYREYDTDIYVADVVVSSPEYLKTAFAKSTFGKNVTATTSVIADQVNSILAINGDYYGVQESGYVIRNSILYRADAKNNQEDLVIYKDGSFEIISEGEVSADELLRNGAVNVLSFGPGLIEGGEITVTEDEEVAKAKTSNPRTAIGLVDDCHYVFVVSDGRTDASEGLSLYELAEFMQELNVKTAYNLDGGGSSTMVFNGTVINNPVSGSLGKGHKSASSGSASNNERSVSDIVYIGY